MMEAAATTTNAELDAQVVQLDEAKAKTRRRTLHSPSEPLAVAREFVEARCLHDKHLTLRYWRSGWWNWKTTHWVELDEPTLRSVLYEFTEHALCPTITPKLQPWSPNRRKITDLMDALAAVCLLPAEMDHPSWLDDTRDDCGIIVSVANGLLDVERRRLLPHTPLYFNQSSVPFTYDPEAAVPKRWFAFLGDLWPNEFGCHLSSRRVVWVCYLRPYRSPQDSVDGRADTRRQGRNCSHPYRADWPQKRRRAHPEQFRR